MKSEQLLKNSWILFSTLWWTAVCTIFSKFSGCRKLVTVTDISYSLDLLCALTVLVDSEILIFGEDSRNTLSCKSSSLSWSSKTQSSQLLNNDIVKPLFLLVIEGVNTEDEGVMIYWLKELMLKMMICRSKELM